jgi:hypothetical protein
MVKEKIEQTKSAIALKDTKDLGKSEGFLIRFLYNNYLDYNNLLYDNSNNN